MKWFSYLPFILASIPLSLAQDSSSSPSSSTSPSGSSSSSSASPSASVNASTTTNSTASNSTLQIITTTLTSFISSGTASPSPSTLVLTLTLNTTAYGNGTIHNSTVGSNATISSNGTIIPGNETAVVWNDTLGYLPFEIPIDGAYGTAGGLLILSGIPVAVLGGKNRWSSLAIISGYSLMLFTLTMILRFGVEPNLQPPSPNPPTPTLRGLYLLACIITTIIGSALGIFLYNFAKYWIVAAGGFSLGWFLLAVKSGGLITSVLGRWGFLGGMTVGAFVAGLPKVMNPWMLLGSSAWIGATAFTLGVDCFVRGGLKEFYIYNLGFYDLFPTLKGQNFPLTQTMSIELGILAATVIIGAAIQFRVLNILQKKLKMIKEEEEARIDAEEVGKAAERFKNVGTDLEEWEEKHGKGSKSSRGARGARGLEEGKGRGGEGIGTPMTDSTAVERGALPTLDFERRNSSRLSLLGEGSGSGNGARGYDHLPLHSPTTNGTPGPLRDNQRVSPSDTEFLRDPVSPTYPYTSNGSVSPTGTDPDLESKMKLLDEVKRAREEVRSSLDKLRTITPTTGSFGRQTPTGTSLRGYDTGSDSGGNLTSGGHTRKISNTSSKLLDDLPLSGGGGGIGNHSRRNSQASGRILDHSPTLPLPTLSNNRAITPISEWDNYISERNVVTPGTPGNGAVPSPRIRASSALNPTAPALGPRMSSYSTTGIERLSMDDRERPRERVSSMLEPRITSSSEFGMPRPDSRNNNHGSYGSTRERENPRDSLRRVESTGGLRSNSWYGDQPNAPIIIGNARNPSPNPNANHSGPWGNHSRQNSNQSQNQNYTPRPSSTFQRTMTYDELSERHRQRLSALQNPVTTKMQEEKDLELAREKWERQKKVEREEMRKREAARMSQLPSPSPNNNNAGVEGGRRSSKVDNEIVWRQTDEWRKSIHGGLDRFGSAPPPQAGGAGAVEERGREGKRSSNVPQRQSQSYSTGPSGSANRRGEQRASKMFPS